RWVEEGVAPERVIARHAPEAGEPTFSRPLCPYPALPRYRGSGDPADAANWDCASSRVLPRPSERILREPPVIRPRG
ncbi:MAG: tannase/feruloyl esterase family alpha/beta hydrolase, partial [Parvularculaceae bacterium]|nr:tannase/feruloyl esterase family alpha/beta hydrolase [Parvularculaceae bacterium]